jgi:hypothetical protein
MRKYFRAPAHVGCCVLLHIVRSVLGICDDRVERGLVRGGHDGLFANFKEARAYGYDAARAQYIGNHPEPALLALVLHECNAWLLDLARRRAEKESDTFVLMASINLDNCIAHAPAQRRRGS